jgi:predicted SprT family Zn-dependent metalloprotease
MLPAMQDGPIIHGNEEVMKHWLTSYWRKLQLPSHELPHVAITQDRNEYRQWTGKRLNVMALGCYWYYGGASLLSRSRVSRAVQDRSGEFHRHLIFIEPTLQPQSIEVTVAHELIHLADRVHGTPRRHTHHGYDSIADDEAAITGYAPEELRALLREESARLDSARRKRRPIRYLYECPSCGRQYPRVRRYTHAVSCSNCDKRYNPQFQLSLRAPDAS